jgi:5'-nucleotidase
MVMREGASGRFPQVSGLHYTIDPTKEPGSRIVSVEVLGENGDYAPIDPEAIYKVVTINFVRTGGDGYTVLAENSINPYDFGRVDYESLVAYLKANSPINAETEGRITYENAEVVPLNQ